MSVAFYLIQHSEIQETEALSNYLKKKKWSCQVFPIAIEGPLPAETSQ